MLTGADVALMPPLSVATAVSIKLPAGALLQTMHEDAAFDVAPTLVMPAKNRTFTTGLVKYFSSAQMLMFNGAGKKVSPFSGFTMVTLGGGGASTLIFTGADVALMPPLSVATAVSM